MALTQAEKNELVALEMEDKQEYIASRKQAGLSPSEQRELAILEREEAEEMQRLQVQNQPQQQPIQQYSPEVAETPEGGFEPREADLGFDTRLKYAIEPLETNRRALLKEKFGEENVIDRDGELYVIQAGEERPVNAEGLSFTDISDIGGALPEGIGMLIGGVFGGGPQGAVAGGVAGSLARQGISAILGTPQEAGKGERAVEAGISGIFSGAGSYLGGKVKPFVKKYGAKVFPKLAKSFEAMKLKGVAKKEGVVLTKGQQVGGRALELEQIQAKTPIFGRKIRKIVDKQVDKVKENIKSVVGRFEGLEEDRAIFGNKLNEIAGANIRAIKESAGKMFEEVADASEKIMVDGKKYKKMFMNAFGNIKGVGMFDSAGNPLKYNLNTGIEKAEYEFVQNVLGEAFDSIDNSLIDGKYISAKAINVLRQTVDSSLREARKMGAGDVQLLKVKTALMDSMETMLKEYESMAPKEIQGEAGKVAQQAAGSLVEKFRNARALWGKYIELDNIHKGTGSINARKAVDYIGKGIGIASRSGEEVLDKIFTNKASVQQFGKLVDKDTVEQAGLTYVRDIIAKGIGDYERKGTMGIINVLDKKRGAIIESIGIEAYNKIKNNMRILRSAYSTPNPSQTTMTQAATDFIKGLGIFATRKLESGARRATEGFIEDIPKRAASAAQVLSQPLQTDLSYQKE